MLSGGAVYCLYISLMTDSSIWPLFFSRINMQLKGINLLNSIQLHYIWKIEQKYITEVHCENTNDKTFSVIRDMIIAIVLFNISRILHGAVVVDIAFAYGGGRIYGTCLSESELLACRGDVFVSKWFGMQQV